MKALLTLALVLGTATIAFAGDDDKGSKNKGKGRPGFGDPAAMFKKLDTNNDGKLSKEEFSKFRDNVPEKLKGKTGGKGGNGQLSDKLFDMMDTNKDGYISLDEYKKMREKMVERMKKTKGTK
ncbi:MAG: EF-hand domain-containing protein [Gemmatales bacterium]